MSMTVTYTKQVSRCKECPNVVFEGGAVGEKAKWRCSIRSEEGGWDKLIKQPGTVPSWCPLRPAPGEEWTRVEDGLPVKDSLSEEDVWVYLGKGVSKPRVTTAPARFKDDGTMFGAFGALTEFVTHWRYRRTPAPPTGE